MYRPWVALFGLLEIRFLASEGYTNDCFIKPTTLQGEKKKTLVHNFYGGSIHSIRQVGQVCVCKSKQGGVIGYFQEHYRLVKLALVRFFSSTANVIRRKHYTNM